ncbi:MAG: glycosyltransferase family 4 protein [Candidatus Scalindua sp.]|nr:glycosyltransferase family 4 protein [Candidatus Scalindua sp.]
MNEIIDLHNNNDIFILSEHSEKAYEVINKPILIKNGLDRNYHKFISFKNRKEKYFHFITKILYDFVVHPICACRAVINILKYYPNLNYGISDYLDVRYFFDAEIDVIHSPFSTPSIIDKAFLLSKILNVPFTLSFRAHDIYEGDNSLKTQKRIKKIREASQIMTISDYNKKYLEKAFHINKNIEIIHSSIDPDFFKPTNLTRSPKSIVTVCRLHEQKGLIYLINACNILNKRNIDYTCTIIGEGSEKQKYDKLIEDLQIPNIIFINNLPYNEVKNHLNNYTVFVLPCIIASDGKRDILANSLKEAMSMEIPVITSNICGIEELVDDGINGFLVPPQNAQAIADAIEKIFNNPDLGRKIGKEGRKKIKKEFNIKIEAGKIEKIFKEVKL